MSDSEEESFGFYGKPLEQYDEDAFPKNRPISVEEQIATDDRGRRRFHGAFTGGFSAGFFNTVGSLEGWTPSEFKSSRSDKAAGKSQKPEDYMDDEDVGQFGIAPQSIKATKDYNTSKKRKREVFADGPIPGDPVLHSIIQSGNETIGRLLLRNMNVKRMQKLDAGPKVYGCQMPSAGETAKIVNRVDYQIPDVYASVIANPRINTFGMSYKGLLDSNVNLFKSSNLVVKERNNKKLSISGQAFGVGAFEDEDEDIYVREDLSQYDFELTAEKRAKELPKSNSNLVFNMFIPAMVKLTLNEKFPPPSIPTSFTGKHKVKKSRFEPIVESAPKRNEINPNVRARYLGEETESPQTTKTIKNDSANTKNNSSNTKNEPGIGLIFDKFVSASKTEDHTDILTPVETSETAHGTKDMREAARMKMYGPLTRISQSWLPHVLLCRRFDIPEPVSGETELKPSVKKRSLVFQNEQLPEDIPNLNEPGLRNPRTSNLSESSSSTITTSQEPPRIAEVIPSEAIPSTSETDFIVAIQETPKKIPDITEKINVSENIDLFNAIFMDSEPEDNEEQNEIEKETGDEEKNREDEFRETVLSQDMLPKIKPMKEGILSNVTALQFQIKKPPVIEVEETNAAEVEEKVSNDSFGPKLPEKVVQKSVQPMVMEVDSGDDWVEKDGLDKDDGKRHKKHKKEKHKKKHKKKSKYK